MKKLHGVILALFIFTSCQDVVQIELEQGAKLFVIDAFINDLRVDQVVRVTASDNYFSNGQVPAVNDAQVYLNDLTSGKSYQFVSTGNGNYTYSLGSDTISKAYHQYELHVTIDGVTYKSITTQGRPAKIDSIVPRLIGRDGGFGPPSTGAPSYRCRLVARDKADNNPDYYWVKTFRNDTNLFNANNINISIDGTNGEVYGLPVDTTKFTEPITFLGFARFYKFAKCRVEIHSITKENYLWFIQAAQQVNNGGLFATTPENVKTNIITPVDAKYKANGRFNMATTSSLEIIVK